MECLQFWPSSNAGQRCLIQRPPTSLQSKAPGIALLRFLNHLPLGRVLVHWRSLVCRQLGVLLLLAALFRGGLLDILIKSNWLVALAAELGNGDCDEAAKSHTDKVGECTSENTNKDRDEDREESAAEEHVHAMVVVVVAVVLHVVRSGVVATRAEPVGWLALECLLCHWVVVAMGALHAVWSLVAAWSSLAHVLQALDPAGHDALPLAKKWPLLAFLLLLNWSRLDGLLGVKRGDHETTGGVLEEVDGDGWWVHGC